MKRLIAILIYIVLAIVIFAFSVRFKGGIMYLPYMTDNCHKCIAGEYYGL